MSASKLALHCHRAGPDIDQAIKSAPFAAVKALDTIAPLQTAQAAGIQTRILRVFGVEALAPADAAARFLSHDLGAVTAIQLVCEQAQGYDPAWQGAVIDALRAGGYRGACILGGYSVGTPAQIVQTDHQHLPQLEPLYGLLRAGHLLGVDAYTAILASDPRWAQWAPYTVLRPTLIHDCLLHHGIDAQMVVLESGGDNAQPVLSGGGWRSRGWSAADYLATLQAIDADDQACPWLLARAIFTLGAPADWSAYDIASIVPDLAAYVQSRQDGPTGPGNGANGMLTGIDVSDRQGLPDWPAVAASGRAFAAVKCSEGVGWKSGAYDAQWAGAGAAGLVRIAYHFARPDLGNTAAAEAACFLAYVGPLAPGDLVALDLEVGGGDLSGWALDWLGRVAAGLGFRPLLYTYPFFQRASLTAPALAAYPLWYASYQATEPPAPAPWSSIAIWQDSDAASVPGVAGQVDGDVTNLTLAQLRALGKPGDPPPPQGGLNEVIQITPAIQAAARARLGALGGKLVPGGALETELIARYALGQANPQLGTLTPTPVVGSEVALPNGRAYCLLDSGEVLEYAGKVDNPEEKDRATIIAQCWPGRFS